jgi:hypothetical protein
LDIFGPHIGTAVSVEMWSALVSVV